MIHDTRRLIVAGAALALLGGCSYEQTPPVVASHTWTPAKPEVTMRPEMSATGGPKITFCGQVTGYGRTLRAVAAVTGETGFEQGGPLPDCGTAERVVAAFFEQHPEPGPGTVRVDGWSCVDGGDAGAVVTCAPSSTSGVVIAAR